MGSQLQTTGGMNLATGLLLAGTIVVAYNIAGARAKPQTVLANIQVSVRGRADTTGKCLKKGKKCSPRITNKKCCPPQCLKEDDIRCREDGEECRGGRECCSGLVCDGLKCGPEKKEECGIVGEECGESKACCNGLMCSTTSDALGTIKNRCMDGRT